MLSMWVAALSVAWGATPVDLQMAVLAAVGVGPERVPAVLGLLFVLARLVDQPGTNGPNVRG